MNPVAALSVTASAGVPPMVFDAEIANAGSTNVRVVAGPAGRVLTVIPR
jgi:hypothetical protein